MDDDLSVSSGDAARSAPSPAAATRLVRRVVDGDHAATDELLPVVYGELRRLASHLLNGDAAILQPTALVHEAYLKLLGSRELDWRSETHFKAIAAKAMRQVLVDHRRGQDRAKRGGGWNRLTLGDATAETSDGCVDFDALEESLTRLAERDERAARVVVMRFFGGLDERTVAHMLGVSERTIRNDWAMARAWLRCALTD